ncbi:hypothetical protein V6N13_107092 [Hibiscus sabdariffa]|uniref:gluconokinase n=1 Tax=Hibiscus sabdariffa TaxID=183260 RepID=A0ABR2F2T4_9ROSI
MAVDHKGRAIVIMGVSGAGKSTIGDMFAKVLNCSFLDADDFHPPLNKDEDRIPWLETLRDVLKDRLEDGKTVILGCSSLQKHYREILRSADADYVLGSYDSRVQFALLDAEADVLAARLEKRAAEGKHFMPVALLQSQLELLHIDEGEGIFKVDATLSPLVIVSKIRAFMFSNA